MNKKDKRNGSNQEANDQGRGQPPSKLTRNRIEAEGDRFLTGILDIFEKYIPEDKRNSLKGLEGQLGDLIKRWNQAFEQQARDLVKKLNLPTKQDLKAYESKLEALPLHLKRSLDEEITRALNRLDVARRTDVENLANRVEKLKKEVAGMRRKPAPTPKRKTPARKTAQA
jgi:hypothetical protein